MFIINFTEQQMKGMRNIPLFASFILISAVMFSCGQVTVSSKDSEAGIKFDTIRHDFGEIGFDTEAEFEFVFTNTGESPLILTHVKSTCGCTVPEWSKEPVNGGKKGKIRVSYDTHRVGPFNKSIYVYSNAENGVIRLLISGRVGPAAS
jgi:hypothetical protein